MSDSKVNHILIELRTENNNLIKDLNLTLKLLETYRNCLISFTTSCKCPQNQENKNKFNKIEEYFNKVNDRITIKQNDQDTEHPSDQQTDETTESQTNPKSEQMSCDLQSNDGFNDNCDNRAQESAEDNVSKSFDEEVNNENNEQMVRQSSNQPMITRKRKRFTKNIIHKRFVCEYRNCNKSFGDNYHLVRHIRGCHTLEKPYKCLKCDKKFAISEGLSQHVKINHKDYQMFRCNHQSCDFKTIIEERLTTHLAKHDKIRRFECEVCHKTYLTKYEVKYHKQRIHRIFEPRVRKVVIKKMNKTVSDISYDSCLSYESGDQNQSYGSETINQFVNQLITDESVDSKPILLGSELKKRLKPKKYRNKMGVTHDIVCQLIDCGKTFLSEYNLRKHMRTVHSDMRPFICEWPGCESTFKTREGMSCHLASHRNERNYGCDFDGCDKRFNTRQEVHQHKRSHGIKKIERYPCSWPACGVLCQSAQALGEHLNRHQNIKPFQCDYVECDKTYFTAYELRQHVLKVHDKTESFRCDYKDCAISFLNKRDLAKHRRLHEDVAKFVCSWPECSHTFNTSRDLSDHMNRHMDIKANKCSFVGCDRSYFKKAHLNRHIKQCHS